MATSAQKLGKMKDRPDMQVRVGVVTGTTRFLADQGIGLHGYDHGKPSHMKFIWHGGSEGKSFFGV